MAALAQGLMRGMGTSGLPRAHTTPTTHSACLGHKAPLSPGQKTQPYLSPQDYQGHRKKAALGTDSLGLQTSGKEFMSYRMVANAVAKGDLRGHCNRGPFCMLLFLFCSETKFPCLTQAGLELTVYTKPVSSSGHQLARVGTEEDTSMNDSLVSVTGAHCTSAWNRFEWGSLYHTVSCGLPDTPTGLGSHL